MLFNLDPVTLIARLVVLIVAFTIHEFAHAWTATQFGDTTPSQYGRLTLNPLAHLDPMGSLLLLFAGFGWAKPVPVNAYALQRQSPASLMWVSLAGPFSNFLLAIVAAVPVRMGLVSTGLLETFIQDFVYINLLLMLFNLIPLSPLDGEKIAEYFAPEPLTRYFDIIRPYGPIILIAVVVLGPFFGVNVLSWIIGPPLRLLMSLLVG
jgi:Zn-dependent protease